MRPWPGRQTAPSRNAADRTVDGPGRRIAGGARILDQDHDDRPVRPGVEALYSIGQVIRALPDRIAGPCRSVGGFEPRALPTAIKSKRGDGMSLIDLSGER